MLNEYKIKYGNTWCTRTWKYPGR